jgi:hypothetical protein
VPINICHPPVYPGQVDSTLNSGVRGGLKLSILACGGHESHSRCESGPCSFATIGKYGRFDAFTRGRIFGLRQGGAGRPEITRLVKKKEGKHPTARTVDNILRKNEDDPSWHGGDSRDGGRPVALSKSSVDALPSGIQRAGQGCVQLPRVLNASACRIEISHAGVHGTIRIVERSEHRAHNVT